MLDLVVVLAPIALLDSASIIPLCIVLLMLLLGGPNPMPRALALLVGIFIAYLLCGLLILLGLQNLFDVIDDYVRRLWQNPYTEELLFQIVVGLILVVLSLRMRRAGQRPAAAPAQKTMTARQAFLAGVALTLVGMPGAVPYLAAIDLILRGDLAFGQEAGLLIFYNAVFILPLAGIVVLRQLAGARGQALLGRIKGFLDRWGRRVVIALLFALGALLTADAIGWFLGVPLIPV